MVPPSLRSSSTLYGVMRTITVLKEVLIRRRGALAQTSVRNCVNAFRGWGITDIYTKRTRCAAAECVQMIWYGSIYPQVPSSNNVGCCRLRMLYRQNALESVRMFLMLFVTNGMVATTSPRPRLNDLTRIRRFLLIFESPRPGGVNFIFSLEKAATKSGAWYCIWDFVINSLNVWSSPLSNFLTTFVCDHAC